jgi:hypothetical protein
MPPFKESLHLNLPYFWGKDKSIVFWGILNFSYSREIHLSITALNSV